MNWNPRKNGGGLRPAATRYLTRRQRARLEGRSTMTVIATKERLMDDIAKLPKRRAGFKKATTPQVIEINRLLTLHCAKDAEGFAVYHDDWDDQRIAEMVKCTASSVANVRKHMVGKLVERLRAKPADGSLADAVAGLQENVEMLRKDVEAAAQARQAWAEALATKLKAIDKALSDFNAALSRLEDQQRATAKMIADNPALPLSVPPLR